MFIYFNDLIYMLYLVNYCFFINIKFSARNIVFNQKPINTKSNKYYFDKQNKY